MVTGFAEICNSQLPSKLARYFDVVDLPGQLL
jgi:hypothetical protein